MGPHEVIVVGSSSGRGRVRTWLCSDPDADPQLVEFVREILDEGLSDVSGLGSVQWENAEQYESDVALYMDATGAPPEIAARVRSAVVVLLRTSPEPSREVVTTHRVARRLGKPVHLLIAPGITAGVDADEAHLVTLDPGTDQLQELQRWSVSLPDRYGRPV